MNALTRTRSSAAILVLGAALTGCSTLTPTYETQEAYVVIDGESIPTLAKTEKLLTDITVAMKSQVSSVRSARSIPPNPLAKVPGNFSMKDITGGSGLSVIAQASGMSLNQPQCDSPILTLRSDDSSLSHYGEHSRFFVCVMPYSKGFRTAVYASYTRASGGISAEVIGASIGRVLVGDGSQFIPRVMDEVKNAITSNLARVKVVQSYIPSSFSGPMVDKMAGLQANKNE